MGWRTEKQHVCTRCVHGCVHGIWSACVCTRVRTGDFGVRILACFVSLSPAGEALARPLCAEPDCLSKEQLDGCWQEEEVLASGRVGSRLSRAGSAHLAVPGLRARLAPVLFRKPMWVVGRLRSVGLAALSSGRDWVCCTLDGSLVLKRRLHIPRFLCLVSLKMTE